MAERLSGPPRLLDPLRGASAPELGNVFLGLALCGVYLYQGHASFFARTFGAGLLGNPYAEWLAHGYQFLAALLLLGLLPLLYFRLAQRRRIAEAGVALGDWRVGLRLAAIAIVALAPLLFLGAGSPELQAEYPLAKIAGRDARTFLCWEASYLVYYLGWELFFRGVWQLGLERGLGSASALALQTAVSTVMHIGKPQSETLSAILGGAGFGLLALRTRSFLWPLLVHFAVGVMTDLFCLYRSGALGS
jgi:membrane protease YdiL (CAAX protease family)